VIDWFGVIAATFWIAGLALLLALLGFARASRDQSTRQVLSQPAFRVAIAGGLALFALGMCLAIGNWIERVGWLVVIALSLWEGKSAASDRMRGGERR
jgi:hypothetical protein